MHTSPFRSLLFHIVRLLPIAFVLGLALFPFGWLGQVYPRFGLYFWDLFESDFAHAIGHSLIFFMLGLLLLVTFSTLRSRPMLYIGLLLGAGIAQEGFQLLYKQRSIGFDEFRDLATDSVAFILAFLLVRLYEKHRDG
jgi:hypothetical protein